MYSRKEVKQRAKKVLKRGYLAALAVCLIMALLAGATSVATGAANVYSTENETTAAVENDVNPSTDSEVINELYDRFIQQNPNAGYIHRAAVQIITSIASSASPTGETLMAIARVVNASTNHSALFTIVLLSIGLAISVLYDVFFSGVLKIGEARFYLENRSCAKVSAWRVFFPWHYRVALHDAWISLKQNIFLFLWGLTIVGFPIKIYSYAMVNYIAAEHPLMHPKDVFKLSQKMMKGNKWHMFVLDLSFLPWRLLGVLTLGLLNIFYVTPYQACAHAEFYAYLRDNLDEATKAELCDAQLATFMGDKPYDDSQNSVYVLGEQKIPHKPINADRDYSVRAVILLFFFFSIVGWLWEVSLHIFKDGVFVNRGTMFGPWLPIYGTGGVLIIILMRRFMKNVPLTFFLTMAVCGSVEYFTSWYLETTKGIKWWDYSGYFMNLNGRICLESLLVFGIGGCAFLYFVAPRVDDYIEKIPKSIQTVLCVVLGALFSVDLVYSQFHPNVGKGITDYGTSSSSAAAASASSATSEASSLAQSAESAASTASSTGSTDSTDSIGNMAAAVMRVKI